MWIEVKDGACVTGWNALSTGVVMRGEPSSPPCTRRGPVRLCGGARSRGIQLVPPWTRGDLRGVGVVASVFGASDDSNIPLWSSCEGYIC